MAIEIDNESDKQFVVAHFVAHVDQPLTCLRLSSSGTLLATADALGHAFHVFSIFSHPSGPTHSAIHHLYTLWRGNTPAQVDPCSSLYLLSFIFLMFIKFRCSIFFRGQALAVPTLLQSKKLDTSLIFFSSDLS